MSSFSDRFNVKTNRVKMPICGKLIVLKATGEDGSNFPLAKEICKFGTSETCDIRVLLPNVGKEHCQIDCEPNGRVSSYDLINNVDFSSLFLHIARCFLST